MIMKQIDAFGVYLSIQRYGHAGFSGKEVHHDLKTYTMYIDDNGARKSLLPGDIINIEGEVFEFMPGPGYKPFGIELSEYAA